MIYTHALQTIPLTSDLSAVAVQLDQASRDGWEVVTAVQSQMMSLASAQPVPVLVVVLRRPAVETKTPQAKEEAA